MSVVGDFRIHAESFALEHALATDTGVTMEADRMASHSPQEVFPFFWATGGDLNAFRDALADDPSIEAVSVADELGDEVLYRLDWAEPLQDLVHDMIDHYATILEATAQGDEWALRLRFAEEAHVSSFQDHFRDIGHEFEVVSLTSPTESRQREFGLTAEQYQALVAASKRGYFSVPRTTSLEQIGDELDISTTAASERIRRGAETLIQSTLLITADDSEQ